MLLLYLRHTSASLVIQENADPDVQTDLITALRRLAPADGPWVHTAEGPDDMPGHIKTMLTGVSLHVPVRGGALALGTWQGIYLVEHRARPHRREVMLQFVGSRALSAVNSALRMAGPIGSMCIRDRAARCSSADAARDRGRH